MESTQKTPVLPLEMVYQILSYLKPNQSDPRITHIYNTSLVCKSWYDLSEPIIKDYQQPFITTLSSKIVKEVFSYLPPNRVYSRAVNIYNATQVCRSWNRLLTPLIKEMGNRALEKIKLTKIEGNSGPLSIREVKIVGSLADENFVSPRLVVRVINQDVPASFTLKILGLAKAVTLRDFNEAVTSNAAPEVLHVLFEKLADKKQECVFSAIERNNVKALQILMDSPRFDSGEIEMLQLAIKDKREPVLKFLLDKFSHLAEEPIYIRYLIKTDIKLFREQYPHLIEAPEYIKDQAEVDKDLLFKYPHFTTENDLLNFAVKKTVVFYKKITSGYLKEGNKLPLANVKKMLIFAFGLREYFQKCNESTAVMFKAYILSNRITNIDDEQELVKFLKSDPHYKKFLDKFKEVFENHQKQKTALKQKSLTDRCAGFIYERMDDYKDKFHELPSELQEKINAHSYEI